MLLYPHEHDVHLYLLDAHPSVFNAHHQVKGQHSEQKCYRRFHIRYRQQHHPRRLRLDLLWQEHSVENRWDFSVLRGPWKQLFYSLGTSTQRFIWDYITCKGSQLTYYVDTGYSWETRCHCSWWYSKSTFGWDHAPLLGVLCCYQLELRHSVAGSPYTHTHSHTIHSSEPDITQGRRMDECWSSCPSAGRGLPQWA